MSLIEFVRGPVVERGIDAAVIALGGIGLRILAPAGTLADLPEPGQTATLYTHLVVREDALTLYGFGTREERTLFTQLLTVSGVGPGVALGALSSARAERLAAIIAAGDVDALARLPRIGKKTAQRIVLDLKGKLELPAGDVPLAAADAGGVLGIVSAALREYGFNPSEIAAAVAALPKDEPLTEEDAVAMALRSMDARRRG